MSKQPPKKVKSDSISLEKRGKAKMDSASKIITNDYDQIPGSKKAMKQVPRLYKEGRAALDSARKKKV